MAVSPDDSADLARPVVEEFAKAEQTLLRRVANTLSGGWASDRWGSDRRAGTGRVRRAIGAVFRGLRSKRTQLVSEALQEAHERGVAQADQDLRAVGVEPPGVAPGVAPAAKVAAEQKRLARVEENMSADALQIYHSVINEVVAGPDAAQTRRGAAQAALDRFANLGVVGFRDRAGRRWELASYVEMATRTALMNVMLDAHVQRAEQAGLDYMRVSDIPFECPECKPWEGKVLAISGPEGARTVQIRGVRVEVAGSLAEARAAGLFHPNCRHSMSPFVPGAPKPPASDPTVSGPGPYAATQRQRALERQVRKWKRRGAVALDDVAKRQAAQRVRETQAEIRKLVAATPGLKRKSHRETPTGAR